MQVRFSLQVSELITSHMQIRVVIGRVATIIVTAMVMVRPALFILLVPLVKDAVMCIRRFASLTIRVVLMRHAVIVFMIIVRTLTLGLQLGSFLWLVFILDALHVQPVNSLTYK